MPKVPSIVLWYHYIPSILYNLYWVIDSCTEWTFLVFAFCVQHRLISCFDVKTQGFVPDAFRRIFGENGYSPRHNEGSLYPPESIGWTIFFKYAFSTLQKDKCVANLSVLLILRGRGTHWILLSAKKGQIGDFRGGGENFRCSRKRVLKHRKKKKKSKRLRTAWNHPQEWSDSLSSISWNGYNIHMSQLCSPGPAFWGKGSLLLLNGGIIMLHSKSTTANTNS